MTKQIMQLPSNISVKEYLTNSKFCLFGIVVCITAFHLILTSRVIGDSNLLTVNFLCWGGLIYLLWQKRDKLKLDSDPISTIIGLLLLILVFAKSISIFWFESELIRFIPFLLAISLALFASGIKGIFQYAKEFVIVLLLCVPSLDTNTLDNYLRMATLTAKFANAAFWYLGWESYRQGVYLSIPSGTVYIDKACTGLPAIILLLQLAILTMVVFKTTWLQKFLLTFFAINTGFIVGGIRVMIMTLAVSNKDVFHYWHGPEGASIFSTIAIVIFGLLGQWIINIKLVDNEELIINDEQ